MRYTTLETIHDLLKSALAAAETEYEKARNEYHETRTLVDDAGDDADPELLETLELDKDRYESCRETWANLTEAKRDFEEHDFN